jgi:hypothetical protein
MQKFLFFSLFVLSQVCVSAQQHHGCGTTFADQLEYRDRLLANLARPVGPRADNDLIYLPCFFHLVANADGVGRGTEQMIFNVMCTLNAEYLEHGIQFYLSPHPTLGWVDKTINHNDVYSTQSNVFLMQNKRHQNAINIYIVDFAFSSSGDPGVLAYYSPSRDWIVCEKTSTGLGDNTMPHEVGHFLSLMHTFFGWEQDAQNEQEPPCFESGDPGWPIAPVTSPGGVPTERQNGTNGTTAADMIADTPPDYNFGYCAPNTCPPYNGGAKDPLGTLVDPQENNFMSYYFGCADFVFTAGQEAAMLSDIASFSRNYLDNTFVPAATSITTPTNFLVSPANNSVIGEDNSVELTWNAVEGATHYLVQIDITPTYITNQTQTVWVEGTTSHTFTGLSANKKHYWRVRPINAHAVCASSQQFIFTTATSSTNDIEQVAGWSIQPNPAEQDAPITLTVNAAGSFDANVSVYDAAGRLVVAQAGVSFFSGDNRIDIKTNGLESGVYLVALESGQNREVKRLVILK